MKRIIRTAVIGYGNRGRYLAGNYSRGEHPGFDLTGVCDLDPARLAMARKVFGDQAAYTSNVSELLSRRDIDAIIVATHDHQLVGTKGKMYGYYDGPGRFLVRIEYAHAPDRRTEEFKPPRPEGGHGGSDGFLRDEFYRRIVEHAPSEDALHSAYYSTALAACAEESIEKGLPVAIPPME